MKMRARPRAWRNLAERRGCLPQPKRRLAERRTIEGGARVCTKN